MSRRLIFFVLTALLAGVAPRVPAQTAVADNATSGTVQQPGADNSEVLAFLKRAEAKNGDTKSLEAEFVQVRQDNVFNEEVTSNGRFWYRAPGQFRASYEENKEAKTYASEIWMAGNKLTTYTPKLKQVEILEQKTGEEAPINQMLLGFGLKVEKIQSVFAIRSAPKSDTPGLFGVEFESKNLDQSMQYSKIIIYFDEKKVEPAVIILEDDQSTTRINLRKVKFNPDIDDKKFNSDWPAEVQVFNYSE